MLSPNEKGVVVPTQAVRLLAAAALAATTASAQDAPHVEPPVFGTGVEVVAVPVFVTDKAAHAVSGLTAADFEVRDRGRPVPIVAFEAVDAGSPTPWAEAGTTAPAPVVQAASRRQFVLLFDLMFSSPTGITRARDAALDFVRTGVAPSDLVAAVTFGQAGLRVLVGLTSDRAQLAVAIRSLGHVETNRLRDPLNLAWDLGIMDLARPGGPGSSADVLPDPENYFLIQWRTMLKADRRLYRHRVDDFLGGLEQLGRLVAGIQGRKQVILFSGGFDPAVLLGADGLERQESIDARMDGRLWDVQSDRYLGDPTARQELDAFYQALAASDSVVHAIDVAGLATSAGADEPLATSTDLGRETLAQFALNTGGRFVKDTSDLAAGLREILDATRYCYVLAFEPGEGGGKKGQLRKLEVKVKVPGLGVSSRRGYVLPEPGPARDAAASQMRAAESIVKGLSGGAIALRVVAVPWRDGKGRTRLPLVLEADGATLAAGPSPLKLEVYGYALDGDGRIEDVLAASPSFDLAKVGPRLRERGLQVITSFAVPAGPADLRFYVRDPASGRTGSLRSRVEVPSFEKDALVLSAPLFVDDPQSRLVLPTPSRLDPELAIPFRIGDAAFTPDGVPVLGRSAPQRVCLLAWRGTGTAATGPVEVDVALVGAEGTHAPPVQGAPRLARDADGFQRIVLTLAPADVPAGSYVLRVTVRDPRTNVAATAQTAIRVD